VELLGQPALLDRLGRPGLKESKEILEQLDLREYEEKQGQLDLQVLVQQ
jgi:hypothetical protein